MERKSYKKFNNFDIIRSMFNSDEIWRKIMIDLIEYLSIKRKEKAVKFAPCFLYINTKDISPYKDINPKIEHITILIINCDQYPNYLFGYFSDHKDGIKERLDSVDYINCSKNNLIFGPESTIFFKENNYVKCEFDSDEIIRIHKYLRYEYDGRDMTPFLKKTI